jgi:hypothetical protein
MLEDTKGQLERMIGSPPKLKRFPINNLSRSRKWPLRGLGQAAGGCKLSVYLEII